MENCCSKPKEVRIEHLPFVLWIKTLFICLNAIMAISLISVYFFKRQRAHHRYFVSFLSLYFFNRH